MATPLDADPGGTASSAQLNQLIMARIGSRMMEPAFQEALRQGDNSLFLNELRTMFDDPDFIRTAMPGAGEEDIAKLREQVADDSFMEKTFRDGMAKAREQQIDKLFLDAVKLAMRASKYRTLFVSDLAWRILPPLMLGQYQFMLDENGKTVALVTWAKLNAQTAARLDNPLTFRLQDREWTSGDMIRIIDVISPLGHEEELARKVTEGLAARKAEAN